MRGHIRKYKGRWAGIVELDRDPITGKRKQKWVYADTKGECQERVNELIYELQAGIYIENTKLSVDEFLQEWLENYAKSNVAPSTYRSYSEVIKNHISPRIGSVELSSLKPFQIQQMYTNLSKTKLSSTTVLYIHRILHRALSQAVKWEMLGSNPASKVDPPKKRKIQYSTWDNATIAKALDLARDTPLYIPIVLASTTGARVGEICALQWNNVDLSNGQIYIIYTLQRVEKEWQLRPVKTDKSNRPVILPSIVINILRQHKLWQKENRVFFGKDYNYNTHVVTWPDGSPVLTEYVTRNFKKFIIDNNLPQIRFHDLRHTHATELLKAGVHPKIVSERLGHSGIRITLDTYSHVIPTLQKDAAEIAAKGIFGAGDEKDKNTENI